MLFIVDLSDLKLTFEVIDLIVRGIRDYLNVWPFDEVFDGCHTLSDSRRFS